MQEEGDDVGGIDVRRHVDQTGLVSVREGQLADVCGGMLVWEGSSWRWSGQVVAGCVVTTW